MLTNNDKDLKKLKNGNAGNLVIVRNARLNPGPEEKDRRYQTKYLHVGLPPDVNHKHLITLFISKGLKKIAVFQNGLNTRAFFVFDKPREFNYNNDTKILNMPSYFAKPFGPITVLSYSNSKNEFETAYKYFNKTFKEDNYDNYEALLYNEVNFFYDLTIKSTTYFKGLQPENACLSTC